ncbi:MAG: hypothetical protein QM741_06960 [Rudaea sp.]|uniref:hypothetical protein n=1 Tax=Rudaea sp. TaxID=2136325 RepID=UPI0039E4D8BD
MRKAFAIALLVIAPIMRVQACSCPTDSIEEAFDSAPIVFIAHITSIRYREPPENSSKFEDYAAQRAKFTVIEALKGDPKLVSELAAGYGGGDCGVPLIVGFDYMVLVDPHGYINYCSGFFGPHYGWNNTSWQSEQRQALTAFTQSVRDHYKTKAKISRPPSADLRMEDSSTLWFVPDVVKEALKGSKAGDKGCLGGSGNKK